MIVANKQNTKLYLEAYQETEIKIESGINDSGELLIDQNGNELTNQGEQLAIAATNPEVSVFHSSLKVCIRMLATLSVWSATKIRRH